jgi:hypothetical protein
VLPQRSMTESTTAHSILRDSEEAGRAIADAINEGFSDEPADALIVFASSRYDHGKLLRAIEDRCRPKTMVGSSSAGEFTANSYDEGAVSAVALRSKEMRFQAAVARSLRADRTAAARQMVEAFRGLHSHEFAHRAALVLTDALAGHADDFIEEVTMLTAGSYQLFGGGAGDDANFTRTHVFYGTEVIPDAAVALEILSDKPIGLGVRHSWEPATPGMRVTESDGMRLISVDNMPAAEMFEEYASETSQSFDRTDPVPFFLHNVIGLVTPSGHKLRVPLGVNNDGSVQCAADIPTGAMVHIMSPKGGSTLAAVTSALVAIEGHKPGIALFFDCVATRLRLGKEFDFELKALREKLGPVGFAGCNTYGQIARSDGQFSGFHNCTAVVAIIPE